MRRLIFILIIFFAVHYTSKAQQFKAGFNAGLTATQVTGDNLSGYDKIGLFGGVFVGLPTGDRGEIRMEMSFIQKGSRKNAKPSLGIYDSYLMRLNYVELPFYYKHQIRRYIDGHIGIGFGYLVTSKEKDTYGTIIPDPNLPYFKDVDLFVLGGFNINFHTKWSFLIRFSYSILPIRNTPIITSLYYNKGQYNDVITTGLQYKFN